MIVSVSLPVRRDDNYHAGSVFCKIRGVIALELVVVVVVVVAVAVVVKEAVARVVVVVVEVIQVVVSLHWQEQDNYHILIEVRKLFACIFQCLTPRKI